MGSGEFEMWMRAKLYAKKTPGSHIRNMQDCMTENVISFYLRFISLTTPML